MKPLKPHSTRHAGSLLWPALLLVLPAHAQVAGSVYGIIDFSYGRFETSGTVHRDRFNSNSLSTSFIGGQVSDTLDGGWKPSLLVEAFLRFQDFELGRTQRDPDLSRNAFAALDSPYGTVRAGRQQTLLFEAASRFNAFGNSTVFSPPLHQLFASGHLESVSGDFYWNRALSYRTPDFDGASLAVMGAAGPAGRNGDPLIAEQDANLASVALNYNHGLWAISLSGQRVANDPPFTTAISQSTVLLGGIYDFGWARAYAQTGQTADAVPGVTSQLVSAGVAIPLWEGSLLLQGAQTHSTGLAVDRKHSSMSAGYLYNFDSLTDIYLLGMDDRINRQTQGYSLAGGVRYRF